MDIASSHLNVAHGQPKKVELETPALPADLTAGLPDGYGDNRLVMMARDPLCIYCYWEFTDDRLQPLRDSAGAQVWEQSALVLRVYDITDRRGRELLACPYFDVEVEKHARQWYVKVERAGRLHQMILGLRLVDGRFLPILTSNTVHLPFGRVSEQTDSHFMAVSAAAVHDEWEKFHALAGNLNALGRGSPELAQTMAERWKFLKTVFSGSSWTSPAAWQGGEPLPAQTDDE